MNAANCRENTLAIFQQAIRNAPYEPDFSVGESCVHAAVVTLTNQNGRLEIHAPSVSDTWMVSKCRTIPVEIDIHLPYERLGPR